jgi:hypothetical protein
MGKADCFDGPQYYATKLQRYLNVASQDAMSDFKSKLLKMRTLHTCSQIMIFLRKHNPRS